MDADSSGEEARAGEETFKDTKREPLANKNVTKNGNSSSQLKSCFRMKEHHHDYIILHSIELAKKCAFPHKQLGEQMPELRTLNANVKHNHIGLEPWELNCGQRWAKTLLKKPESGTYILEVGRSDIYRAEVAHLLYFPLHRSCCRGNNAGLTALTNWPVKPKESSDPRALCLTRICGGFPAEHPTLVKIASPKVSDCI